MTFFEGRLGCGNSFLLRRAVHYAHDSADWISAPSPHEALCRLFHTSLLLTRNADNNLSYWSSECTISSSRTPERPSYSRNAVLSRWNTATDTRSSIRVPPRNPSLPSPLIALLAMDDFRTLACAAPPTAPSIRDDSPAPSWYTAFVAGIRVWAEEVVSLAQSSGTILAVASLSTFSWLSIDNELVLARAR
ncbi:hypothetical protein C8F01DRAFT_1366516 [Mycena amicta]|nr:hypothetical protein C8F01DRAFT_1366516 [Mycena amicta]